MAQSSLGHLAATVSLDINPFKASNNVLKAQIRSTAAALRATDGVVKAHGNNINAMRQRYSLMQRQMQNYTAQLQRYKAMAEDTSRSDRSRANAATQANKASAQIEILQGKMESLSRTITLQANRWTQLSNKVRTFGSTVTTVGGKISAFGDGLTSKITMPIAAGLAYAAKQEVQFEDTMNKTKNVIRTSGESAKETQSSYNQMLKDARKYSDTYGVSQNKIAQGYQDLVKRGYTSKAALGVMNSELKTSIATGDDFNDVIKVGSEVMESFGLSTTKTGKPIKNATVMQEHSKKVLNELAFAADATSTDFQSLGIGMSYVGSIAHQAGFGVSETAAAMGILSNNGLEADKAGTGLRKVIQSLISPTASGTKALAKLNLKTSDFVTKSGKLKSMSTIFGMINKQLKAEGIKGNEKNDIFHALFGTTGQQAGSVLSDNAKRLRELNKEVKESTKRDYIGDLSNRNLKSAKSQIAIAKESLTNAGMDLAKNVLPAIIPLIQGVGSLARAFGRLSPAVQSTIAKFVLATTIAGPLLSLIGRLFTGVGKGVTAFATLAAAIGRFKTAASLGATGTNLLRQTFSKTAFEAAKSTTTVAGAGTALAETGEAAGTAATGIAATGVSLGTLAATAGIAGVALVGGIAIWELWGKKAYESSQQSAKWGSAVGSAADHALSKMQSTSQGINDALTNMDTASHTTAKSMSSAFDKEFSQIEQSARDHFQRVKESEKGLSQPVKDAIDSQLEKEKKQYNDYVDNANTARRNAQQILSTTNGTVADLSASQRTMLRNNQQQLLQDEMKVLNITGDASKKVIAALNGDVKHMTAQQRESQETDLANSVASMKQSYLKQEKILKDSYGKNSEMYKAGHKANLKALNDYVSKASAQYIKLAKANGMSTKQIKEQLEQNGLDYTKGMKQIAKQTKEARDALKGLTVDTQNMSGKTKKAANMWNNLVFDPKTGKVKTNAQDEVNKAVKSKDQWNQIKLLEKKGKLSTNAKSMVAAALIENGKWNKMSWNQKRIWLKDDFHRTIVKALTDSKTWNDLDLKTQEAIVKAKGKAEMVDILMESGAWNKLSLKKQEAVIQDKATIPIYESLKGTDTWNNMTLKQQEAIINAKGKADLVDALAKGNAWNALSLTQKEALVTTKGTDQVIEGLNQIGKWNSLSPKVQQAIVTAKGGPELADILTKYGLWNGLPASALKQIVAQDKASGQIKAANDAIARWNEANPHAKNAVGHDQASGPFRNATQSVFSWNNTGADSKTAHGSDGASAPFGSAIGAVGRWNNTPAHGKSANTKDGTTAAVKQANSMIASWNSQHPVTHWLITKVKKVFAHAKGTNYHPGGPMMVNDQPGSVFRELVKIPGQAPFIPVGRNVVFDAPKGTKVLRASATARQFHGLPQYSNGTTDAISVLNNLPKAAIEATPVTVNSSQQTINSPASDPYTKQMATAMEKMIGQVSQLIGLSAAQIKAVKAGAFDKSQLYGQFGIDQHYFNQQQI